jgi:RNA polymerase sigma-70 factor (ECF subfamily)
MKTHKEIGAMLGISEKTVENHITKALHTIKGNLNSFFCL